MVTIRRWICYEIWLGSGSAKKTTICSKGILIKHPPFSIVGQNVAIYAHYSGKNLTFWNSWCKTFNKFHVWWRSCVLWLNNWASRGVVQHKRLPASHQQWDFYIQWSQLDFRWKISCFFLIQGHAIAGNDRFVTSEAIQFENVDRWEGRDIREAVKNVLADFFH